jgi:hypothetical protein
MYYTYLWLRENGSPYYIGKGKGIRAYTSASHGVHCPPFKECIIVCPAASEADAFETEIALIWYYGRKDLGTGCLRNLTDGGENPPSAKGRKMSARNKAALRKRMSGWVPTGRQRKAVSESNKRRTPPWLGKHLPKDHKQKLMEGRDKWAANPDNVKKVSERVGKTLHVRWHVNRNIIKEDCKFCKEK